MAEDRDKKREEGQKRPSRPVTAAARRERRASEPGAARPAARAKAEGKASGDAAPKSKRTAKAEDRGTKGAVTAKASKTARPKAKSDTTDSRASGKGRPTPTRDRKEGQSLFGRIARFLREVVAELRKVIWPTKKQMITYTTVVLVFVAFMVALIWGLDQALARGVLWLFG